MTRNFPNFLDAYCDYANDDFVPPQFNEWVGLSVISGALERKVWMPWKSNFAFYPNIFVLLVSLPGVGKSTALTRGVHLLQDMNLKTASLNILPSQITEAEFINQISKQAMFEYGTRAMNQSAGYYFASEASNELKNVFGDFIAALTAFYDCPQHWEKATVKDGKRTLTNVSLNLLAGSTFDYLGKLVTDDNIMGGFASRLIYVVHKEKIVRLQKFGLDDEQSAESKERSAYRAEFRRKLVEDLIDIHKLVGPFTANAEYGASWEAWHPVFEERRQSHASEKMQSLLVRTNTNLFKVSMLLAAAESRERVLKKHHWDRAIELVTKNESELPGIFRQAKAADTKSQEGLNNAIALEMERRKLATVNELKGALLLRGFHPNNIDTTVARLEASNMLIPTAVGATGITVKLAKNVHNDL